MMMVRLISMNQILMWMVMLIGFILWNCEDGEDSDDASYDADDVADGVDNGIF